MSEWNRARIARERDRNVRRKLAEGRSNVNGPDTCTRAKNEQKETRTGTRRAGTSADRGRAGVRMPCANRTAPELVAHPPKGVPLLDPKLAPL